MSWSPQWPDLFWNAVIGFFFFGLGLLFPLVLKSLCRRVLQYRVYKLFTFRDNVITVVVGGRTNQDLGARHGESIHREALDALKTIWRFFAKLDVDVKEVMDIDVQNPGTTINAHDILCVAGPNANLVTKYYWEHYFKDQGIEIDKEEKEGIISFVREETTSKRDPMTIVMLFGRSELETRTTVNYFFDQKYFPRVARDLRSHKREMIRLSIDPVSKKVIRAKLANLGS